MRSNIIIALMLIDCVAAYSQNLLPNPGFEDENICTELVKPCAPSGWELVYVNDLYNYTNESNAHSGKYYSSIATHAINGRKPFQYIESPILCPLIKGKRYQFSMYTLYRGKYFGDIGVYFSANHICIEHKDSTPFYYSGLAYSPQLVMEDKTERNGSSSNDWTKEKWEYTAEGNERFIIIGNFLSSTITETQKHKNKADQPEVVNVRIDDVALIPEDSGCDCDYTEYHNKIYTDYRHRHTCIEELPSDSFITVYEKIELVPGKPVVLKNINFNTDKSDLLPSSYTMLDSIVSFLKHNENIKLEISGHTDNQASAEYNLTLSENRANAVMTYLILHGINGDRLAAVGYGNTMPVGTNDTEEGRAANRRVEIKILPE